jgi:excisionase family DNA binding protein
MPRQPASDRLLQLVALLVHEQQRLEYERSGTQVEKQRPEPPGSIDLTPYAHLSDLELSQQLGFTRRGSKRPAQEVVDERSGRYDKTVLPGRTRCEAGVKAWLLLRCHRMAAPGERWCQQHHPAPPPSLLTTTRLHPWDLALRPDGALLKAIYELSDRTAKHIAVVDTVLARLERAAEREAGEGRNVLDALGAAEYLGVTRATIYGMCAEHRLPFSRIGNRYRFRAADLDAWLAKKAIRAAR